MTNFDGQWRQFVDSEVNPPAGDHDTGTGNEGNVSYQGAPLPASKDIETPAAGHVPYTFEELHPEFQVTDGAPRTPPVATVARPAPRWLTRSFAFASNWTGDPLQVLQRNIRRRSAMFLSAGASTLISHEGAALTSSQGVPVPTSGWLTLGLSGEVYAMPPTGQASTLYIIELLDS